MSYSYGNEIARKAEREGYITLATVLKPQGKKGNNMKINKLTPKSRRLLERLNH